MYAGASKKGEKKKEEKVVAEVSPKGPLCFCFLCVVVLLVRALFRPR